MLKAAAESCSSERSVCGAESAALSRLMVSRRSTSSSTSEATAASWPCVAAAASAVTPLAALASTFAPACTNISTTSTLLRNEHAHRATSGPEAPQAGAGRRGWAHPWRPAAKMSAVIPAASAACTSARAPSSARTLCGWCVDSIRGVAPFLCDGHVTVTLTNGLTVAPPARSTEARESANPRASQAAQFRPEAAGGQRLSGYHCSALVLTSS